LTEHHDLNQLKEAITPFNNLKNQLTYHYKKHLQAKFTLKTSTLIFKPKNPQFFYDFSKTLTHNKNNKSKTYTHIFYDAKFVKHLYQIK